MRNILSELIWLDGIYTSKGGETGDAQSANAAMALVTPQDARIHRYVNESFIEFRPFRSPLHAKDPNVDLTHSFSRDHMLSLVWYSAWSSMRWPILFMAKYISMNKMKIGKEGTYSQHGVTPNVLWAMNSIGNKFGPNKVSLPWYYKIWPSIIIAFIQLLSAKSVRVGYKLNLCGELALIAKLTGQWNWVWEKVILTCIKRHPENLYYQYIQGNRNEWLIRKELEAHIETFQMSHEWCWCWMNKTPDGKLLACGQDLLFLKALMDKFPLQNKQ